MRLHIRDGPGLPSVSTIVPEKGLPLERKSPLLVLQSPLIRVLPKQAAEAVEGLVPNESEDGVDVFLKLRPFEDIKVEVGELRRANESSRSKVHVEENAGEA